MGGMAAAAQQDPGMAWMASIGAMAIVILPIFYGVIGFIAGSCMRGSITLPRASSAASAIETG